VTAWPPKVTAVLEVNLNPVMATSVPPLMLTYSGFRPRIVATGEGTVSLLLIVTPSVVSVAVNVTASGAPEFLCWMAKVTTPFWSETELPAGVVVRNVSRFGAFMPARCSVLAAGLSTVQ